VTTAPQPSDYSVVVADPAADREAVIALWRDNLPNPSLMDRKYHWFYCDGTRGPPMLTFLKAGDERVGVAGFGIRELRARGVPITGGLLADFVVVPAHRTLYPALLLQKELRDAALRDQPFVYGIPNDKSLPILRRLGFIEVGQLVRYTTVLRHSSYLRRRLPGAFASVSGGVIDQVRPMYFRPPAAMLTRWRGEWVETVDERFDRLWERSQHFDGIIGTRDARFLAWRFLAQPGRRYRIFTVWHGSRNDIAAYAICETVRSTLFIRDLLVDPAVQDDTLRVMVHFLAREAYKDGFVSMSCELLGDAAIVDSLKAAGMLERERLQYFASFSAADARALHKLPWYATRADFDV
jgi:hypothetical protein